jgi:hypothetical protein
MEDLVSSSSRFRDNFHPSGFPSHPEGEMPGYIDAFANSMSARLTTPLSRTPSRTPWSVLLCNLLHVHLGRSRVHSIVTVVAASLRTDVRTDGRRIDPWPWKSCGARDVTRGWRREGSLFSRREGRKATAPRYREGC